MSPPRKRRRLSESASPSRHSRSDPAFDEPTPTFSHIVSNFPYHSTAADAPALPTRIAEIHVQIQQQQRHSEQAKLYPRQPETLTPTTNAQGSTVLTNVSIPTRTRSTKTRSAHTLTSSTTSLSSNNNSTTTTNSRSTGTSNSSSSAFPSLSSLSRNATLATSTRHHTTTLPILYLATLTNDNVKTLTRHSKAYATSFADGQTLTVCNRFGNCRLSDSQTSSTTKTTPDHSTKTTSRKTTHHSPSSPSSTSVPLSPTSSTPTLASPPPSPSSGASSSSQNSNNGSSAPLPSATIAGGVVGGFAGIAVILLVALIVLRWYKRRAQNGHHALPADSSAGDLSTAAAGQRGYSSFSSPGGMASLTPLVNAVPALFRHQNRSEEGAGTGSFLGVGAGEGGERSFTRVSGRKLPSAFSEGMSREDFSHHANTSAAAVNMPLRAAEREAPERYRDGEGEEGDLSGTSFYRDSRGFYGGSGPLHQNDSGPPAPRGVAAAAAASQSQETGRQQGRRDSPSPASEEQDPSPFADPQDQPLGPTSLTLSPGPQRRPTIHAPGPYHLPTRFSSSAAAEDAATARESVRRGESPVLPSSFGGGGGDYEEGGIRDSRFREDV